MIYTEMTKKAIRLCFEAHRDQLDRGGLPYVFHPFHVAEQMPDELTTCAALLHDVVEDTPYSIEDLRRMGFDERVLHALELLTHDERVPYIEYVKRAATDPIARQVKLADLRHNRDLSRLETVDEKALRRAEKYDEAIRLLERMREMDNKAIVRAFIEEVFNAWDVSNLDKFMREDYRQHNPGVEDGRAGFVKFCEFFFSKHPHMEIVHLIGDGDLVAVFFKCTVDDGVNKVVDIYRLQDGKIAEHWDVVEHGIDPDAKGASGNGLF